MFDEYADLILNSRFNKRCDEIERLNEGLITSFSADNMKRNVIKSFASFITYLSDIPLFYKVNKKEYKYGIPSSIVINFKIEIDNNPDNRKELTRIINLCGYFIAEDIRFEDVKELKIVLEPRFPVCMDSKELDNVRMFHITEKKRLNNILHKGLNAKNSRTSFAHTSDRIYLFITKTPELCIPELKKVLTRDRISKPEEGDMVVLEIKGWNKPNIKFYLDEAWGYTANKFYAIFTKNSIPPAYIEIYK